MVERFLQQQGVLQSKYENKQVEKVKTDPTGEIISIKQVLKNHNVLEKQALILSLIPHA